jgi:hypothetical protein
MIDVKTRNLIYKEALQKYKDELEFEGSQCLGMCYAIWHIPSKNLLPPSSEINTLIDLFPEISKHRPQNHFMHHSFWFPNEDTEIRIKIFEQAIKETEE